MVETHVIRLTGRGSLAAPLAPRPEASIPPRGQHTMVETHVIRLTGRGSLAAPLAPHSEASILW